MTFKLNGKEYDSNNEAEKREYFKDYLQQWRKDHPDKVKEYVKKSNEKAMNDPERKQKKLETLVQWREKNIDKLRENARRWHYNAYHNNPEYREKQKAYMNNRYNTDEEFRKKMIERSRQQYALKKASQPCGLS